ncbi:hypothetical protein LNL84_11300 [Vibrio sp. ZSDZ34]|jgi:cell division inhibitor SulA|uniref:50S ribosomal protein L7ae n=1 Tax=Vibrio gelatinilyticus TaxID=2893468 RepID=A0A9X1WBT0_9VIBR|nr:hypothetical protein [Vibrio gelatinilyticus]MCJ2377416.1 hypothetical protein [Vibrio gelatinilyticus]
MLHSQTSIVAVNNGSHSHPLHSKAAHDFSPSILKRLSSLACKRQWVLLTSQCRRPTNNDLTRHNITSHTVVQIKPSSTLSEFEIVEKALRSRNACAVVASHSIPDHQQVSLRELAAQCGCEIFFTRDSSNYLH